MKGKVEPYFDKGYCVAYIDEAEVDCWEADNWGIPLITFLELGMACGSKIFEHEFVYNEGTDEEDHKYVSDTYFENYDDACKFLRLLRIVSNGMKIPMTDPKYALAELEDRPTIFAELGIVD